jgi:hypothetical protein
VVERKRELTCVTSRRPRYTPGRVVSGEVRCSCGFPRAPKREPLRKSAVHAVFPRSSFCNPLSISLCGCTPLVFHGLGRVHRATASIAEAYSAQSGYHSGSRRYRRCPLKPTVHRYSCGNRLSIVCTGVRRRRGDAGQRGYEGYPSESPDQKPPGSPQFPLV